MPKNKFLTVLLAGVLLFSGLFAASCGGAGDKTLDNSSEVVHVPPSLYAETFFPTEASDLNVEQFRTDFQNSKYYYDMAVEGYYISFKNYMPENYAEKYNIGAFEVIDYQGRAKYYIWHEGEIYCVDHIGANPEASFRGFVQFFISDMNVDGAFELTVSYHLDNRVKVTYLTAYDSATKKAVEASGVYEKYAFFKNAGDRWAIYTSDDKNIENATTKYSDIGPNANRYVFTQKTYHVEAKNYKVDITIDEDSINFPIYFKRLQIGFKVKTSMTWLGETFSYENGDSYLNGAHTQFLSETDEVESEAVAVEDVITYFTIPTGCIIEREYLYRDVVTEYRENRNAVGVYAIKVGYRFDDEKIVIEDALQITNG